MYKILGFFAVVVTAGVLYEVFTADTKNTSVHSVSREINQLEEQLQDLQSASTTAVDTAQEPVPEAVEANDFADSVTTSAASEIGISSALEVAAPAPAPKVVLEATVAEKAALLEQLSSLDDTLGALLNRNPVPYIEIAKPSGYVNSDPFKIADFIGEKVILVKFTTYSCYNCQATYPYVINWHETYKDQGLQVIAVHTPEFAFEKDIDNVRAAMKKEGITFPVVLDNDKATWRAYSNHYWPRMYLIDINGNIVYDHIGEGAYDTTEKVIQRLLKERNER